MLNKSQTQQCKHLFALNDSPFLYSCYQDTVYTVYNKQKVFLKKDSPSPVLTM